MADQEPFLLKDEDFWSIIEDEKAQNHLQREACRVTEMISSSSLQKENPTLNLHSQKRVDSLMKSTTLQAQTQHPARRLVDLIRPSKASQSCSNLHYLPAGVFWALIKNKRIGEHIGEQANRVVEMINERPWLVKKEYASMNKVSAEVNLLSFDSEMFLLSSSEDTETELLPSTESPAGDKSEPLLYFEGAQLRPSTPKPGKEDLAQACEKVKASVQLDSVPTKRNPKHTLHLLASNHWEDKFTALTALRDLAMQNPESLKEHLRKITISVSAEVKNLRSVVSGAAMSALSVMFTHLKKSMNDTVAETGAVLLQKVSDSSKFLQQQANEALASMVENCNPIKVLNVLVNVGVNHGNSAVRASAALNISRLLDVVGPKGFSQLKGFSEVIVFALSGILKDGSADVRRHGMTIYQEICSHEEFTNTVLENQWRAVQGFVNKLRGAPREAN